MLQIKQIRTSRYAMEITQSPYLRGIMMWDVKTKTYLELDIPAFIERVEARHQRTGKVEAFEPLRILALLCTPTVRLRPRPRQPRARPVVDQWW